MTIMEKHAAEYGIEGFQLDPPLEYDTVQTGGATSLTLIADVLDIPVPELAALNPASLRGKLPENYPLRVPKGTGNQLMAALQLIPANRLDAWRMHRVASGDTLAAIGKRFGVPPAAIVAANRLDAAQVAEGDRLMIPAAARAEVPVVRKAPVAAAHRRPGTTTRRTATASVRPAPKRTTSITRASN